MSGIIVCGDRNWGDADYIYEILDTLDDVLFVIEGEAKGADTIAAAWAKDRDVNLFRMPAEWETQGHAAGPIRNGNMLRLLQDMGNGRGEIIFVVAFHHDIFASRGTANMVKQAQAAGVEVRLFSGPERSSG